MSCRKRLRRSRGPILRDDEITLTVPSSRKQYPKRLRRIEAEVEIKGEIVVMVFITNNFDWAAGSVCDLYRSRWGIEAFFKQIKQTLKVCDFLGTPNRPYAGNCGARFYSMCCCVFKPGPVTGLTASPGCLPCCVESYGTDSICLRFTISTGQHPADGVCALTPKPPTYRDSPPYPMGQHPVNNLH